MGALVSRDIQLAITGMTAAVMTYGLIPWRRRRRK